MKPLSPLSIRWLLTAIVVSFAFGGQGIWAHQTALFLDIDPVHVTVEAGPYSQAIFSCRDVQWLNQAREPNILGLDPPPETMPCTKDNVVDVWGNGAFGLVVWWSHGLPPSGADVIGTNRVMELNDERKVFTFQASCNTARPEEDNNLTYEMLKNSRMSPNCI